MTLGRMYVETGSLIKLDPCFGEGIPSLGQLGLVFVVEVWVCGVCMSAHTHTE